MPGSLNRADARAAAGSALLQLFDPLARFAIDAGLSVGELNWMLRYAAVKSAATKQRSTGRRVNISGIAALTGISRSEISRLLKQNRNSRRPANLRQPAIYRILEAWHELPKFTDAKGSPLDLRLYGRGATFESLVRTHGGGIPIRAMLDEMVRIQAVEVTGPQKVRLINSSLLNRDRDPLIAALGNRTSELISTIVSNIGQDRRGHVSTIVTGVPTSDEVSLLQKNLTDMGSKFISKLTEDLAQIERPPASQSPATISVTFFYHLSDTKKTVSAEPTVKRHNFRRDRMPKAALRTSRTGGAAPLSRVKHKP